MNTGFSASNLHYGREKAHKIWEIKKFPEFTKISKKMKTVLAKERLRKYFELGERSQRALSDAYKKITKKMFHLFYEFLKIQSSIVRNSTRLQ